MIQVSTLMMGIKSERAYLPIQTAILITDHINPMGRLNFNNN